MNCPQLSNTIQACSSEENRCYKLTHPGGVSRGCSRDRCSIHV